MRKLVENVIQIAKDEQILFLKGQPKSELVSRYTLFVSSLTDTRAGSIQVSSDSKMLVAEEDFITLMNVFRTACGRIDVSIEVTQALIEFLESKKSLLCE